MVWTDQSSMRPDLFVKPLLWSIRPRGGSSNLCGGRKRNWWGLEAEFGAKRLSALSQLEQTAQYEHCKGRLFEQIQHKQKELDQLKGQRKQTERHLSFKELAEQERFSRLARTKEHFADTIKLIAYRAGTVLVALVREKLARSDDAGALER